MGPEADRAFWRAAAQVSRDYFVSAAHPVTALTPDYGNFDGSPWAASWRPESADFRYDAWRSAMNWSMDWSWWRADPRQVGLSNRLQGFFLEQGLDRHASLYTLDGQPLGGERAPGLVAMNATASLAADHPRRLEFVRALWEQPLPTGRYRYYDGVLQLMALLHLAGDIKAGSLTVAAGSKIRGHVECGWDSADAAPRKSAGKGDAEARDLAG
jgi:oligosaccharide reducing-end xylanase